VGSLNAFCSLDDRDHVPWVSRNIDDFDFREQGRIEVLVARLCDSLLDAGFAREATDRKHREVIHTCRNANNPDATHCVSKRRHNLGDVPGDKLSLVFDPDALWPGPTKGFYVWKLKTVKWGGKEHGHEYIF
jgi:hypothetical protein